MFGRPSGLALGIIPDWQYATDPRVNININPHVTFPAGWNQRTIQPPGLVSMRELQGPSDPMWWWDNRKWVIGGALVVGGLFTLAVIKSLLR